MSLLEVAGLTAGYGPVRILHGIDLDIHEGDVSVVLGANGAGKTTLLRALSGMIPAKGTVMLAGESLIGKASEQVASRGVAHVPQGRGTFTDMSVEDNLKVGGYLLKDKSMTSAMDRWFETFPRLSERRKQQAGSLSGGEQQMLAIARALMSSPRLLLLDEPSLGLAPNTTADLFSSLSQINNETDTTILVVEQNAHLALAIGDNAVVIESGKVVVRGTAAELEKDDGVRRAYLGY
ncbi:amino acid/amide ABC transporter ATP-binding protein 2 (HAAT family) [Antricoccus suffuscus]|uniref:Amino acid/amide ABC transporter ATP-binding protein 2 (HAAT family) n=1 Tax=Antricoccus suffuscus TaxID=1629062 RepID=A0A2T0ZZL1_9ACTN|nr:ABC transporter ATP-binding protein [Antricoccus suffuscus]PRZ41796.1 amino acid/amide ABC transporter ATP-binding protein 2 (HAAT family) [Antricoccus suffuscus]